LVRGVAERAGAALIQADATEVPWPRRPAGVKGAAQFAYNKWVMRVRFRNPYLRLTLVFFLLVLGPSLLLGYFSLRAVENERVASQQRLVADYQRYVGFASRSVQQALLALESTWEVLVPRAVGWEPRLDELAESFDAARGQAFVHRAHLLHVSGARLYPMDHASPAGTLEAPGSDDARLFRELMAAAETAEFESKEPEVALQAYRRLLADLRTKRLRAIAQAGVARVHMRGREWDAAIAASERIIRDFPSERDLDNQSLRLHAKEQIARALEQQGELASAARALVETHADVVAQSDEIAALQFDIITERIASRLQQLLPRLPEADRAEVEDEYARVRSRPKKPISAAYFVHKLSRKLVRAMLDGLAYSTRVRYLSDTVEGRPFLLAYLYLPDASGTAVAGLAGLELDLQSLSEALFPRILQQLELSDGLDLVIVDESGRGVTSPMGRDALATSTLGVPFEFWSVAVRGPAPQRSAASIDFRTKVFLYVVLLLLLTIVAGAAVVIYGLRRQSRLSKLKTGFVSSVSHELRTPLTSIRMYTEMLQMAGDRTPRERAHYLGTIQRECDRLQRLVEAVLDFARMERGTREYHFEFEEIGPLVLSVAEDFRAQAEAEGFEYTVDVAPDLSEVRVDADAIRRVVLNLLSNAVKYSDEHRWIAVRVFRQGSEVAIQVQDRGIGIDADQLEKVFEDFYRVDSSLVGGVGLGLTLVRSMAEAHGGRVNVESRRGGGSTFTVWLPLEDQQLGAPLQDRSLRAGT
jgi:signal transduction histidine kinase